MRTCTAWFSAFAALFTITLTAHAQLSITDVGRYDFTDTSGSGARELSGLAYLGYGSSFLTVGDKDALVHFINPSVDFETGSITSASINATPTVLQSPTGGTLAGGDREAIAIYGGLSSLIANETGPMIEKYSGLQGIQSDTTITTSLPGFEAFDNIRPNRGWESLTVVSSVTNNTLLTANEDALTVDGPAASFTAGAFVRIQAAALHPSNDAATAIGQFAYPIDAINGDNPFASGETSGLVELLALPSSNKVLAMERSIGLTGYRIRIYQIDGGTATDISGLAGLDGLTPNVDYKPLGKTLLWEKTFSALSNSNFEGLGRGHQLSNDRRSLILIADNASGPVLPVVGQQWTTNDHSLYALTLDDDIPACSNPDGCHPADLSEDGFVGIDDLNIILSRWNQVVFPGSASDPSVDGFVGIDDLNIILANWNAGTPPTGLTAIPEPASAVLLGLLSFMCVKRTPANRIQ